MPTGDEDLTALVQARLAPLRIITAGEPARLDDWLPRIALTAGPGRMPGGTAVTCRIHHRDRRSAEQAASTVFRLLNGWDPPGPWHRCQAGIGRIHDNPDRTARIDVVCQTRREGPACPRG